MFLKTHRIFKDGKQHIYYSLCESLRVSRKRVLQRRVLHLGELNTTQLERWQRTIEVVEEDGRRHQMRLFTDRHGERRAAAANLEETLRLLPPQLDAAFPGLPKLRAQIANSAPRRGRWILCRPGEWWRTVETKIQTAHEIGIATTRNLDPAISPQRRST